MLAEHLLRSGAEPLAIHTHDLVWSKRVKYADALENLRLKLHSEYWGIPQLDYQLIVEEVQDWIGAQPQGPDTVEVLDPSLTAEVYRLHKPPTASL